MKQINIDNLHFNKSFMGYNSDKVDNFSREIIDNYNKLLAENKRLHKDLYNLRKREAMITKTLITAQDTSDKIVLDAKKEAKAIIKKAHINSKKIIEATEADLTKHRETIYKDFYNYEGELTLLLEEFYTITRKHMDNLENEFIHRVKNKISAFNTNFNKIIELKNSISVELSNDSVEEPNVVWQEKEYALLLGKTIGNNIFNNSKEVILSKDTIITPKVIELAIKKGYYGELVSSINTDKE